MKETGAFTSNDLMQWATMILLNDAYDWEGPNEDEVAERLHELSMPQIFTDSGLKAESFKAEE